MKKVLFILIGSVLTMGLLAKDKFFDKPMAQWKKGEVLKMLSDSPWAKQQTYVDRVGGTGSGSGSEGTGVSGDKEVVRQYTIRFFTALPVREAYVRMMQLMNNYEGMSADQKVTFDQRASRPITMDVGDQIIVAGEFATNNVQHRMDAERRLRQATAQEFKQSVYLISDRLGQVQITSYFPPSPDGTGFKFVFPRTVDGKPVIAPEDKEVTFKWWFDDQLTISFKVKDMMYKGKVEH